ncbi:MAG: hypothetical protein PHD58_02620 [Anaerolineales bacterium]|nr:hypothetical protein [Anaerolineales bacterium]
MMAGGWILAQAFQYPAPGALERLQVGAAELPPGEVKERFQAFLRGVERLSLGEWEELFTRTLDLNPAVAPYLGFQAWGESYQRGKFMAQVRQALLGEGLDEGGELPDHLAPVLRYLDRAAQPLPELLDILQPAVARMLSVLAKADAGNPYLSLLEAVQAYTGTLAKPQPEAMKAAEEPDWKKGLAAQ